MIYVVRNKNRLYRQGLMAALRQRGYREKPVLATNETSNGIVFASSLGTCWHVSQEELNKHYFAGSYNTRQMRGSLASLRNRIPRPAIYHNPSPVTTRSKKAPLLPPSVARYTLTYQKTDGSQGNYEISPPIEATPNKVTVYAFGKGVRTFVRSRILSVRPVS